MLFILPVYYTAVQNTALGLKAKCCKCVCFRLVSCGWDKKVILWDTETAQVMVSQKRNLLL